MGRLVKLIGSGIGLATEAVAARKAEKAEKAANADTNTNAGEGSSAGQSSRTGSRAASSRDIAPSYQPEDNDELPPQYAEVSDQQADQLIAKGKAVPLDSKDELRLAQQMHDAGLDDEEDEDDDDLISVVGDEEQWDLDDAIEAETPGNEDGSTPRSSNQIAETFLKDHPAPPPAYTATASLPCPVIIPQRRPRDKTRGFVRAYAPVLEDCGIDQATFLDFLKTFHQSSKEDPWLNVVNLAAAGAGFAPSAIAMGVSIAVQFAVGVAMEVQRRTRTNSFLDRMNNEFFKPRGLYCLIITYKPDSSSAHEALDINKAISSYMSPADGKMKNLGQNMRLSSGKTYGEMELPEAAPLIFPALDRVADDTSAEGVKKQTKMKSTQKFVSDYFDRRAQAQYAAENPGSSLAVPTEKQFASRYSDPNHAANNGSLLSLITGGVVDLKSMKQRRKGNKRIRRAVRRGEPVTDQTALRRGGRQGFVKKMLQKDVLYLMIVNLPSESERQAGQDAVRNEMSPSASQSTSPRPQGQQQIPQNEQQYHQQQYQQTYEQQQRGESYEQDYKQQYRQEDDQKR